jgi:hypothetical protein
MTSDSPLAARVVLGILAAFALSIPLGVTLHDAHELTLLENTAHNTDGRVTKKHCKNHGKVAYSYVVDTHTYMGEGTVLDRSCDDVHLGDSIDIIYSAQKPQLSTSDSLAPMRSNVYGSFFALAVFSLAAPILIFRITRVAAD